MATLKPIVVIRDINFSLPLDNNNNVSIPSSPHNWFKFSSLINGPRTILYSGCYLEECAQLLHSLKTDPTSPSSVVHFYSCSDYLPKLPIKAVDMKEFVFGCAVTSKGDIIVSTYYYITVYDSEGRQLHSFGSKGDGDGQFNGASVAVHPLTNWIYVSDFNNHRIQVFDDRGNFQFKIGSKGNADGQLNEPYGIAMSSADDKIVVCDYGNHRVQVFDSRGKFLLKFGSKGSQEKFFRRPYGVAVTSNNGIQNYC